MTAVCLSLLVSLLIETIIKPFNLTTLPPCFLCSTWTPFVTFPHPVLKAEKLEGIRIWMSLSCVICDGMMTRSGHLQNCNSIKRKQQCTVFCSLFHSHQTASDFHFGLSLSHPSHLLPVSQPASEYILFWLDWLVHLP